MAIPPPPPSPPSAERFAAQTLGVVGVGLIGGSIAQAALQRGVTENVIGFGRNAARLADARDAGAITAFGTDPADASEVDLLVVCTPVSRIAADVAAFAPHLPTDVLITDAGSVKAPIAAETVEEPRFVPAHPLAGSEKAGWEHADGTLFEGRVTVVCPTQNEENAARAEAFWEALGSRVVRMDARDHDERLARTSHLPHALAAALCLTANVDPRADRGDGRLTSTGFAGVTRVAAGDAGLWADIFLANADPLCRAIDRFGDRLTTLRNGLMDEDRGAVERWLETAATRRSALINASLTSAANRTRAD